MRKRRETKPPALPPEPPYGLKEMGEDYQAILRICDGDKERARVCFDAYLAGRIGVFPRRQKA